MRAVEISHYGGPEVLQVVERPIPQPSSSEVLIRVAAAGVARADLLQRQGKYPPPAGASDIPGLDATGVVERVGSDVKGFRPGDRVCAILAGGGYAEYCLAPHEQVLPVPEGWSLVEAASLPENLFTVYDNIVTRARLKQNEWILIHGGSGGIGSMAIMLAGIYEATVIATAGSDEKCQACLNLGARYAINYQTSDFVKQVLEKTNGSGVDVILDVVGGAYLEKNISTLSIEGRLALIATQGGHIAQLDLAQLMKRRASLMGSTMRARTPSQKGAVSQALLRDIWPLLPAKNFIRPFIDTTFEIGQATLAHKRLESGQTVGKILLSI